LRTALAVIVGYMSIFVLMKAGSFAAYLVVGTEEAFRPGDYLPSDLWIAISLGLGFVAAIAGGFICAGIARDAGGPNLLAAALLVVGLAIATFVLIARLDGGTAARPPGVGVVQAMLHAASFAWVAFVSPFVGIAGVLAGSRLQRLEKPAKSPETRR